MPSTYQDIIDDVRIELTDELKSRWSDDTTLLRIIAKAFRRVNHLLWRNEVEFGRSYSTQSVPAGQDSFYLPSDFLVDWGLFNTGAKTQLTKCTDDSWEQMSGAPEMAYYIIRGDTVYLASAATTDTTLSLIYWPVVNSADIEAEDPTPYDGKLDDLVVEYAALRCKNIDEMDVTMDTQLLKDLENNVLNTLSAITPTTVQRRGWLV